MKKIALIGLGNRGKKYLKYLAACSDAQLIAVCDNNPENVKSISEKENVRGYTCIEDLLSHPEQPDAVIMCLPHHVYLESIEKVAQKKFTS